MQVLSGPVGRQRIHFEAPPAKQLETETATFLKWANASRGEPPLTKVGLAHLWFVTLHPFGARNLKIVVYLTTGVKSSVTISRDIGTY
jgi:Fic family protein